MNLLAIPFRGLCIITTQDIFISFLLAIMVKHETVAASSSKIQITFSINQDKLRFGIILDNQQRPIGGLQMHLFIGLEFPAEFSATCRGAKCKRYHQNRDSNAVTHCYWFLSLSCSSCRCARVLALGGGMSVKSSRTLLLRNVAIVRCCSGFALVSPFRIASASLSLVPR